MGRNEGEEWDRRGRRTDTNNTLVAGKKVMEATVNVIHQ